MGVAINWSHNCMELGPFDCEIVLFAYHPDWIGLSSRAKMSAIMTYYIQFVTVSIQKYRFPFLYIKLLYVMWLCEVSGVITETYWPCMNIILGQSTLPWTIPSYVKSSVLMWLPVWHVLTHAVRNLFILGNIRIRADSRFAPSQWETLLQSNAVSLAGRKPRISPENAFAFFVIAQHAGN